MTDDQLYEQIKKEITAIHDAEKEGSVTNVMVADLFSNMIDYLSGKRELLQQVLDNPELAASSQAVKKFVEEKMANFKSGPEVEQKVSDSTTKVPSSKAVSDAIKDAALSDNSKNSVAINSTEKGLVVTLKKDENNIWDFNIPVASEKENGLLSNAFFLSLSPYVRGMIKRKSLTEGFYININGGITTGANRCYEEYEVKPGDEILIIVNQEGDAIGANASIMSFFKDNDFIENLCTGSVSNYNYEKEVIVPQGANKLLISRHKEGRSFILLPASRQFQDKLKPGEGIHISEDNTITTIIDKKKIGNASLYEDGLMSKGMFSILNQFEPTVLERTSIVEGFYISTSGVKTVGGGRCYEEYKVSSGMDLQVKVEQWNSCIGGAASIIALFNGDTFIANMQTGDYAFYDYNVSVKIPEGVDKLIISRNKEGGSNISIPARKHLQEQIKPGTGIEIIDGNTVRALYPKPQIFNYHLPYKNKEEEINVLLIGSSYGVDTISGVTEIASNLGVNVNTGNLYIPVGSPKDYLEAITKNSSITYYFRSSEQSQNSTTGKTVKDAINHKNWDVIILQNNYSEQMVKVDFNESFAKFLAYVRQNIVNPRTVFAINNTWAPQSSLNKQSLIYEVAWDLSIQSGIDLIVPSGRAIELLRQTSLNDGHDIQRDDLHLNLGIGRYTVSCALFESVIAPICGVSMKENTFKGFISLNDETETYPRIEVTDGNRNVCIECALKAVSDRFGLVG